MLRIRSLIGYDNLRRHEPFSALPHNIRYGPLYLNIFRGEPAISGFVWHIAPNLKSSQPIATDTSAVLLPHLRGTQPAQG